jgi:hypothetical protein
MRRTLCIGWVPIVLFLSMSCPAVAEDNATSSEPNDGITVEQVLQRLEQVEAKLHSFRVHCVGNGKIQFTDFRVDKVAPARGRRVVPGMQTKTNSVWHYQNNGSSRFEADRVQVDVIADGSSQVQRYSAYSVFDGPRGRGKYLWLNSPDSNDRMSRNNAEKYTSAPQGSLEMCPIEFLTRSSERSFSEELRQEEAEIARREKLDDRAVVVLATRVRQIPIGPNIDGYLYREFWVDIDRGLVVRLDSFARDSEESAWNLMLRRESSNYEWDAGSQMWLPTSAKEFGWNINRQGQRKLYSVVVYAYNHWEINPQIDDETFSIDQDWSSLKDRR